MLIHITRRLFGLRRQQEPPEERLAFSLLLQFEPPVRHTPKVRCARIRVFSYFTDQKKNRTSHAVNEKASLDAHFLCMG